MGVVIVTIRQELGDPREDLKNKGLVLARIECPEGMEILVFDNKVKETKILIIKLLIARVMNVYPYIIPGKDIHHPPPVIYK